MFTLLTSFILERGLKNTFLFNRKEMDTKLYTGKLDKKGLYLWCLPERAEGRQFLQTHKIGMTTRSFGSRNKQYSGIMKQKNWTANFLLPLSVDNDTIKEMETFVKKEVFQYAISRPNDIFPQSKDWTGEYYDVVVREGDNFKQFIFDLFHQVQNSDMLKDLINTQKSEIEYLKSKLDEHKQEVHDLTSDTSALESDASNVECAVKNEESSMLDTLWRFAYRKSE
jgi:hypothetical protein